MGEMKRAIAREEDERRRQQDRFSSTLVIAAAIIAAVRLARDDISRPSPRMKHFTSQRELAGTLSLLRPHWASIVARLELLMAMLDIISALDAEINRLQQARSLLTALASTTSLHAATATKPGPKKRRKMSAAARKRIGDAQRKRWAKQKSGK